MKSIRLTHTFVKSVTRPGRYGDGRGGLGLSLLVKKTAAGGWSKIWSQRLRIDRKIATLGFGSFPVVTLADARKRALDNARRVDQGEDILKPAPLPFGHPGRRCDDTPEGFEPSPLVDQGPERDYTPDEYGRVIHYGPGDRPLCGSESMTAAYTDDPALVVGCADCLELAAEDLDEDNEHWANCLHCQQEISA